MTETNLVHPDVQRYLDDLRDFREVVKARGEGYLLHDETHVEKWDCLVRSLARDPRNAHRTTQWFLHMGWLRAKRGT